MAWRRRWIIPIEHRTVRLPALVPTLSTRAAGRVFGSWCVTQALSQVAVPYSMLQLTKFIVVVLMMSHWFGCLWLVCGNEPT